MECLSKYNPEAEFSVVVNGMPEEFCIEYGSSEGVTEKNADKVVIVVRSNPERKPEKPKTFQELQKEWNEKREQIGTNQFPYL